MKYAAMWVLLVCTMVLPACEIDDIPDPNNPTTDSVSTNATIADLNVIVVGTESGMRNFLGTYYDNMGVIGREHYRFSNSDPRFASDLLGAGSAQLDANTFYTTNPWAGRYRVVKNANLLIAAADSTTLITEEQANAYKAFAKTIKAHQLLLNLTMMYEPGIRINVEDPDNLGEFVTRDVALDSIASLLDQAVVHLDNAGDELPFQLSSGFDDLILPGEDAVTPEAFRQFNRALAARVDVYREDFSGALEALEESFLELDDNFEKGVYYVFGTGLNDELNPVFVAPNSSGEIRIAHPSYVADISPNDDRISKVAKRQNAATQSDLTGEYDVTVYRSNTDPIPLIRNEELILIYAEANIQTGNLTEAIKALNIIRQGHGLTPYIGAITRDALITEMLRQRRYSLYFEGHRWVDLRRYDRLDELPTDRAGDDVWVSFPKPFNEV